ncbi:MAG: gamma carbonic anhydrase family protein [Gammaproteobacteria bacterium]
MTNISLRPFLDHTPKLGERVFVDPSAVVIGQVTLADDVSIWPLVVARGDVNYIEIGARSNIQDGSVLHVASTHNMPPDGFPLVIGEDVLVGHKVMLHGCRVGDRCLIGMDSIVMDGAVIEQDVLLAAGSLVAPGKVLESGYLYQGRPARRVRALSEAEMNKLSSGAAHYVRLKNAYLDPSKTL